MTTLQLSSQLSIHEGLSLLQKYCPSCYYRDSASWCIGCRVSDGDAPTHFRLGRVNKPSVVKDCNTCKTLNCNSCKGGK